MRYMISVVLATVFAQHTALGANVCSQEEIRAMIFDGASMRQVETLCANAREAFSRPLPGRPAPAPAPAPTVAAPAPPVIEEPNDTEALSTVDPVPEVGPETATPPAEPVLEPSAADVPSVATAPDPFDDPYIVAVATPESLVNSDWRSRIPRPETDLLTPMETDESLAQTADLPPEIPDETVTDETVTDETVTSEVTNPAPSNPESSLAAEDPTELPPMQITATPAPARGEPAVAAPIDAPEVTVSTHNLEPPTAELDTLAPADVPEDVPPPQGDIPVADLSAVATPPPPPASTNVSSDPFPSPEPETPVASASGGCPETSLWWSGGPSPDMQHIDICSIQLELGELQRYYELVPFTGLNATTDRRFDADRNGISDKGLLVDNTIFWGGRDCSDGVVRVERTQCDAVEKSGCAVVSLHLRARPGQRPTTLSLQPRFFLLFPNGSRLPSDGKVQTLNYRGCGS